MVLKPTDRQGMTIIVHNFDIFHATDQFLLLTDLILQFTINHFTTTQL